MPDLAHLVAVISTRNDGFARGMKELEAMAARSGRKIALELANPGGASGLKSGVINEILVLFREIGRGNWTRVPGSLSLLLQRMGVLGASVFSVTGLVVGLTAAVAGVAGGFYIWSKRVDSLAKSFNNLNLPDLTTKTIGNLSAQEQGQKKISDAINEAREAAEIKNMTPEQLRASANEKKRLADSMRINTIEEDRDVEENRKRQAESAKKSIAELEKRLSGFNKNYVRFPNTGINQGGPYDINRPDFEQIGAIEGQLKDQQKIVQAYNDFLAAKKSRQRDREFQERLYSQAAQEFAAAEKSEDTPEKEQKIQQLHERGGKLTSAQKVGAYIGGTAIAYQRQSIHYLRQIAKNTSSRNGAKY